MQKLNVGFIGCGRIADLHYKAYCADKRARVYALCDIDQELLQARATEWKVAKIYRDYRELLADKEVDAVEILVPHSDSLHEKIALQAIASGKHVALQKPITTDLAGADRIVTAARQTSKVFKVTENYVFYPPIQLARKMIDEGEVGEPLSVRIKFISGSYGGWPVPPQSWRWRVHEMSQGRGTATFDHGHHLWATAWFLLGEVDEVIAWIDRKTIVDCPATVMWKYRHSGRYGSADLTHCPELLIPSDYYTNDEWIEIAGTRGLIRINRCSARVNEGAAVSVFDSSGWKHYDVESDWAIGFVEATKNFIDAIVCSKKPLLNAEEGREILRFALAVRKSAVCNRSVCLDELDSKFPTFYRMKRQVEERIEKLKGVRISNFFEDTSKYAPQALPLTRKYLSNFDASAAAGWDIVIGLHLTADGDVQEELLAITIRDGKLTLDFGDIPANAALRICMPHGVWAAILLRKKRPEVAFFQGKIKVEGQLEQGLKLRELFKL